MPTVWHISINAIKTASFFLVLTISMCSAVHAWATCMCVYEKSPTQTLAHTQRTIESVSRQTAIKSRYKYRLLFCLTCTHPYLLFSFIFCWFRSGLFMTMSIELELHTTFDYFKNESEYWEIDGINWTLSTFLGNSLNFFEISFLREKERQQHPHL